MVTKNSTWTDTKTGYIYRVLSIRPDGSEARIIRVLESGEVHHRADPTVVDIATFGSRFVIRS